MKKESKKSVIVKYAEFSGVKLTVGLPIIDKQIKYGIKEDKKIVHCHFDWH